MYDAGLGEYITGVPSSKVPIASHSKARDILSLLKDGPTVAGPATPGVADTADDENETEREAMDVNAGDLASHGCMPLTDDQRKMAEKAALMMGLRSDSVGENISFGEILDHNDGTKHIRKDVEKFAKELVTAGVATVRSVTHIW